jgi:hypothetical protein
MTMTPARAEQLYEDDFLAWTRLQAKELRRFARTRPNVQLDLGRIEDWWPVWGDPPEPAG